MLNKLKAIIVKNIYRLLRSKTSALVILFGPLLLVTLIGITLSSTGLYGINVGYHTNTHGNLSTAIVDELESRGFTVRNTKSTNDCIQSVREGRNHVCIALEKAGKAQRSLQVHVDYSKLNLAYNLINIISRGTSQQAKKIGKQVAQNLISKINQTSSVIQAKQPLLRNLTNKISNISTTLARVNQSLQNMETNITLSAINISKTRAKLKRSSEELASFESKTEQRTDEQLQALQRMEDDIAGMQKDVTSTRQRILALESDLSATYNNLKCSATGNVFDTAESSAMTKELKSSSEPHCLLLYSMKRNINERLQRLKKIQRQLETAEKRIGEARQSLKATESEVKRFVSDSNERLLTMRRNLERSETMIQNARKNIQDIQEKKEKLASTMTALHQSAVQGGVQLETVSNRFKDITRKLQNLSVATPAGLVEPIMTEVNSVLQGMEIIDYVFPSLIMLVLCFTAILLASTLTMREKESRAYFRNTIAPTSDVLFVGGTFLTGLMVVFLQLIIVFVVGLFYFNVNPLTQVVPLFLALLSLATIFICIGMIIGYVFQSEETSTLAAVTLGCIFLLFSSLIVPLEQMNPNLVVVARYSPFILGEAILRQILLFKSTVVELASSFLSLLLYIAALVPAVYYAKGYSERRQELE